MAIITRTLNTYVTGGGYPLQYTWHSDCDANITYATKTGVINADGALSTNFSYDDSICLQCNFYIDLTNDGSCYGSQNNKGIRSLSCGNIVARTSDSPANIVITQLGINTNIDSSTDYNQSNITFQTYTIQVTVDCSPLIGSISVNNTIQHGNGTFTFTETTSYNNPDISIYVSCT